jgi:cellulose synthase/poly-beta-1,6-N-acetylglucosamine synthase-like glycosyltransferase
VPASSGLGRNPQGWRCRHSEQEDHSFLSQAELVDKLKGLREKLLTWALRLAVGAGVLAFAYYLSWWLDDSLYIGNWYSDLFLLLLLVCAVAYGGVQLLGNWYLYLVAKRLPTREDDLPGASVDVFVTVYNEPYSMIENTLKAACAMNRKHSTWLLADRQDPQLAKLAETLGVGYLTRPDRTNAKAGNLNAALKRTTGEIVVIFDVDHVPAPDFLNCSLGFFKDPQIGFVQVMLTFANVQESWVAEAAIETSLEFYNPTSLGAYSIGGATLMGSNALIRRKALDSIGGYQPGLAEDLATSIALHAAGWKSAYVAKPLAPGLAPPTFNAWFIQQMKWARGVFELLVSRYPKLFSRLTGGQRLSYAVRMTKYWIGPAVAVHMFATIAILIFGGAASRAAFHSYLIHITPVVACDAVIRYLGLYQWRQDTLPRTSLLRAVTLVYATWPIYLSAWLMALFRVDISFQPTPKSTGMRLHPLWLAPQFLAIILLFTGLLYTVIVKDHRPSILLIFAILQGVLQLSFLIQWTSTDIISRQNGKASNKISRDKRTDS